MEDKLNEAEAAFKVFVRIRPRIKKEGEMQTGSKSNPKGPASAIYTQGSEVKLRIKIEQIIVRDPYETEDIIVTYK